MALARYLAPSQTYIPVDLVARDERTIVLDLEHDDLSLLTADARTLLGVISDLFDVPVVLSKIRSTFARSFISYHVCSGGPSIFARSNDSNQVSADGPIDSRLEHGWVNHYSYDELILLFERAGLAVVRELNVDDSQFLFELEHRE